MILVVLSNSLMASSSVSEPSWWAIAGGFVIFLGWFAFIIWMMGRIFSAYKTVPKELAGIRKALERIADRLEKES